ncbi:MAG: hypothetical protein AAF318_02590 [Pseudomonadota bacterium]
MPPFIPGADGSDYLFNIMLVSILVLAVVAGVVYLRLHSMPERLAHGRGSGQLQAVAALTLLALLTHNQVLWLAALLIALVRVPDLESPLRAIAEALRRPRKQPANPEEGNA